MTELTKTRAIELAKMDSFVCGVVDDDKLWNYWTTYGVHDGVSKGFAWKDYICIAEDKELYENIVKVFNIVFHEASEEEKKTWQILYKNT